MYSSYYNTYNTIATTSIIIYILSYFGINILFGIATKHINESKGYDGGFAWGFWLGIIGIIVVACKADNRSYETREYKPMYPNAVVPKKTWNCVCGQENAESLTYCTRCRRTRDEGNQAGKVACRYCGAMNKPSNENCFACGRPMKEISAPVISPVQESKPSVQSNEGAIDILKQLAQLHEQGILTDQEFETKKAEILAKIS